MHELNTKSWKTNQLNNEFFFVKKIIRKKINNWNQVQSIDEDKRRLEAKLAALVCQ